MYQHGFHWMEFYEINRDFIFKFQENSSLLQVGPKYQASYMKTLNIHYFADCDM